MPLYFQHQQAIPEIQAIRATSDQSVISLVPSQTELLFDLGVGERVVGATKFCVHPAEARQRAMAIGGTKQVDFGKIDALRPSLIIANKEENTRADIERLAERYPVWVSDIADLPEALAMIRQVGTLVGATARAEALAQQINKSFAVLAAGAAGRPPIPAAYLIWRKPWMAAGAGTFIDDMLRRAGFANVFGHLSRYPEVTAEMLAAAAPARVLLSSEPYPFQEKHRAEVQALCPTARVQLVDGELFSWYGSRLLKSAAYFKEAANW